MPTPMRIAVAGRFSLGGVKMRGEMPARVLRWRTLDVKRVGFLRPFGRLDAIVLVKHDLGKAARLRRACDRLVWDPLDAWQATEPDADPAHWWRREVARIAPDDVLATSPSCARAISEAISASHPHVRVRTLPHAADPRVQRDAGNPAGPIVYAGDARYLGGQEGRIREAAQRLGRTFVVADGDEAFRALDGAALSLCVRLPPHDTPLNRLCKPQVKLENAAAAGVPVLASDHPCVATLRPEAFRLPDLPPGGSDSDAFTVGAWIDALQDALASRPLRDPVTLEHHAQRLHDLLESADTGTTAPAVSRMEGEGGPPRPG